MVYWVLFILEIRLEQVENFAQETSTENGGLLGKALPSAYKSHLLDFRYITYTAIKMF